MAADGGYASICKRHAIAVCLRPRRPRRKQERMMIAPRRAEPARGERCGAMHAKEYERAKERVRQRYANKDETRQIFERCYGGETAVQRARERGDCFVGVLSDRQALSMNRSASQSAPRGMRRQRMSNLMVSSAMSIQAADAARRSCRKRRRRRRSKEVNHADAETAACVCSAPARRRERMKIQSMLFDIIFPPLDLPSHRFVAAAYHGRRRHATLSPPFHQSASAACRQLPLLLIALLPPLRHAHA